MGRMRFYNRSVVRWVMGSALALGVGPVACSTTELTPKQPPDPPAFTRVVHPRGTDLSDLSALFTEKAAPREVNFSKECDRDLIKLKALVKDRNDWTQGVLELVKKDPVFYHWCFYGKILKLETDLKSDNFLDVKHKTVLDAFSILTPLAQSFAAEFHDSRYLRWAVMRYQKISPRVFFRKLDLTPEGTSLLVQPTNPFGLWRKAEGVAGVLEKYHFEAETPAQFLAQSSILSQERSHSGKPGFDPSSTSSPRPSSSSSPAPLHQISPTPEVQGSPSPIPSGPLGVSGAAPSSDESSNVDSLQSSLPVDPTSPGAGDPVLVPPTVAVPSELVEMPR